MGSFFKKSVLSFADSRRGRQPSQRLPSPQSQGSIKRRLSAVEITVLLSSHTFSRRITEPIEVRNSRRQLQLVPNMGGQRVTVSDDRRPVDTTIKCRQRLSKVVQLHLQCCLSRRGRA
nr:hypothetical protein [Streptomyces sp. H39-C1]